MLEKQAYFKDGEWALHTIVHQLLQITVTEFINYVNVLFSDEYFTDSYYIVVSKSLNSLHLSDKLFWYSVFSFANFDSFQSDNFVCALINGFEYLRICSLSNSFEDSIVSIYVTFNFFHFYLLLIFENINF